MNVDGTEIDDYDSALAFPGEVLLYLQPGEAWQMEG